MFMSLICFVVILGTYITSPDVIDKSKFFDYLSKDIIYFLVVINIILIIFNEFNIIL